MNLDSGQKPEYKSVSKLICDADQIARFSDRAPDEEDLSGQMNSKGNIITEGINALEKTVEDMHRRIEGVTTGIKATANRLFDWSRHLRF